MVNWVTTMQQEIPSDLLSRLSSFDALGTFALAPVGVAAAGPLAAAFSTSSVLLTGGAAIVLLTFAVLLVPEVRQMRRQLPQVGVTGGLKPFRTRQDAGLAALEMRKHPSRPARGASLRKWSFPKL